MLMYLLIEHQTNPDPLMGLRLYSCEDQIWEMERRTWRKKMGL